MGMGGEWSGLRDENVDRRCEGNGQGHDSPVVGHILFLQPQVPPIHSLIRVRWDNEDD